METKFDQQKPIAMFIDAGNSIGEAMRIFECTRKQVINACHAWDIEVPKDYKPQQSSSFDILSSLSKSYPKEPIKAIAKKHGVTKQRVSQIKIKAEETGLDPWNKVSSVESNFLQREEARRIVFDFKTYGESHPRLAQAISFLKQPLISSNNDEIADDAVAMSMLGDF